MGLCAPVCAQKKTMTSEVSAEHVAIGGTACTSDGAQHRVMSSDDIERRRSGLSLMRLAVARGTPVKCTTAFVDALSSVGAFDLQPFNGGRVAQARGDDVGQLGRLNADIRICQPRPVGYREPAAAHGAQGGRGCLGVCPLV